MKRFFHLVLVYSFLYSFSSIIAQGDPSQQKEGYFISPKFSSHGIIVTDDFESSLYLIKNNKLGTRQVEVTWVQD